MDFCVKWEPQTLQGKIYHAPAQAPQTKFRAGSSWCIVNMNCCFLLGALCFFGFLFFAFFYGCYKQKTEKRLGEVQTGTPLHMLSYATCYPWSIVKSKTHNIECFRTFPHWQFSSWVGGNESIILVWFCVKFPLPLTNINMQPAKHSEEIWIKILKYVLFCGLVKPSLKKLCIYGTCDWTTTSHAKVHLATEIQHTDFNHHCKDFEAKEWHAFEFKDTGALSWSYQT